MSEHEGETLESEIARQERILDQRRAEYNEAHERLERARAVLKSLRRQRPNNAGTNTNAATPQGMSDERTSNPTSR